MMFRIIYDKSIIKCKDQQTTHEHFKKKNLNILEIKNKGEKIGLKICIEHKCSKLKPFGSLCLNKRINLITVLKLKIIIYQKV